MQPQITPTTPELIAADKALRRAALRAKELAEKQGVPYVVQTTVAEKAKQTTKKK